ncbi:uncharacterized protein ColSpa_11481 [Colletotrichum spaethianum]|uniref:Uncharacterized protein n=1 Tax=Colletotrichum spaethianum TaxID=700344 RepID=A0AA37UPR8_9PEZI|nr:uncharacterized protein ColSpa_11481 [Colletotrichum spaethianum]GKT51300.1 hypothetical protein ColSpa_11481 [Colletotrichum spaethianum]
MARDVAQETVKGGPRQGTSKRCCWLQGGAKKMATVKGVLHSESDIVVLNDDDHVVGQCSVRTSSESVQG